jgi:hypothetical protein
MSDALGEQKAKKMKYDDFLEYMHKGSYIKPSDFELKMLNIAKQKTYGHIKGLGEKQKTDVRNSIFEYSSINRDEYEEIIGDAVETAIRDRRSVREIVLDIGNETNDWLRDLGRIADTEYNNVFQEGRSAQIKEKEGKDAKVYKDVYDGACFPTDDTEYFTNEGFKKLNNDLLSQI